MDFTNKTPFPNFRFINSDNRGREFGVVVAKGTFTMDCGRASIAEEQARILFEDRYHGALNTTSLRRPSDVVSRKVRTDVILDAIARSDRPREGWDCRISVGNVLDHRLHVCGPRRWLPCWKVPIEKVTTVDAHLRKRFFKGWSLEEPAAVAEVPLRYELAYGGRRACAGDAGSTVEFHALNPIGRGFVPWDDPDPGVDYFAPQIVAADERHPAPSRHCKVAGVGPTPPSWPPRIKLGGTFDEHWQRHVWPRWPTDYDFAYNNSAHPDLSIDGFLKGDETVTLEGFFADGAPRTFRLPGIALSLEVVSTHRHVAPMDLDTLFIDASDEDPGEHRIFLSWRATYDLDGAQAISISSSDPNAT